MLQSLKNITRDIKLKERESGGLPVGSPRLSDELSKIDERLEQDLIYYRKTILDILDDVNSIQFLNLKQEQSLHTTATKLNVLFDEIKKNMSS
jgi:hypothetical protein|tara:strand:+ start:157 stop:435 length:279 start_codon:yes stop_codon:yes gene_type:complete